MREENTFLPAELRVGTDPKAHGDALAENKHFFDLGIDGMFTDYPDSGVLARAEWWAGRDASG